MWKSIMGDSSFGLASRGKAERGTKRLEIPITQLMTIRCVDVCNLWQTFVDASVHEYNERAVGVTCSEEFAKTKKREREEIARRLK